MMALQPISATHAFTRYYTSAAPITSGLAMDTVQRSGVQTLTVSAERPLVLFNLDVSLEWDARQDGAFLEQLAEAFRRASAVLFDISDGQMALGDVRVHQNKEHWVSADLVIYASNSIHPRASLGGVVITPTNDIGPSGVITDGYWPGQIRMGPNWVPFGQSQAELAQDWWLALTHELAHYLFFLPDNYLGVENNLLRTTNCQGSLMTNAYDIERYSELAPRGAWAGAYSAVYAFDPAATQHWRLFDPTVASEYASYAGLVNTLDRVEFGRSYWIHATKAITPYLGVELAGAASPHTLELPPATLFGPLITAEPAAWIGRVVTATINGQVCGQGAVQRLDGQPVYAIQVAADVGNGCGLDGRPILLSIAGSGVATQAVWDNRKATFTPVSVDGASRAYLPLVRQ
jgi:hypothetical protein